MRLLFLPCFVSVIDFNIPATNGLISPTNVSLIVDKDNLHVNDSGSNSTTVSSSVGSSTITVIDKPSAVPPRGCSIHFQLVPLNETNVISFSNVTTATSTTSCARKCYLSGCTVAQYLPGVPDGNTGTCRLSFGSEPSKCQLPDTSQKLKPEDPAHIQCLRCMSIRRTTTITTPILPSTTTTTTTVSILKLSDNEVDSSIDSSPKIIPPSTQTSPKILEQLKSSELFLNSIISDNLKTLTQNDSTNTVDEWKTTTVQSSLLKPVKLIDNKFQPKAFIAATAEFENGSNLTLKFVGDEKYSNPPGVVPEKPGFSPDFNETAGSNSTNDLENFPNSTLEGKKNFTETTILTISVSINLPQNMMKVSNDATERTLIELNSTSNVTLPVNLKSVNESFDNETAVFMNSTSTVSPVSEFSTQNSLSVNHTASSVNQTNLSNEISSHFSFQKSGPSSNETAEIYNETVSEEHNNFTSSVIQLEPLSTLLPATIATKNVSANSAVNSTQSPRVEFETNRTTNPHLNNLTTEFPSLNVTDDFPSTNATVVLPLKNVTADFHVSPFDNFTHSAGNETSTISQIVNNNSSLQVNSSNQHDTSGFIIGNHSLPVNDAVAEIQNKHASVVSSKLSSFKGFGGGCAVFFHISNASAVSTAVFTNTTSATSVSNCARKCYLFGCRVAQYIPNGSLCRLSFSLQENELCTQYHKEYTGFATEDPVQLECLRCSNKKIQSPLQGPL